MLNKENSCLAHISPVLDRVLWEIWVIQVRFKSRFVTSWFVNTPDLQTSGPASVSVWPAASAPSLTPYLSFSGVQVATEDSGLPQGSSKGLTLPVGAMDVSLPQPPVMETGEAGPPGKMTSSKLPKGTDGSMMPVQGFAGAPGESPPHVHTLCLARFPALFHVSHAFFLFYFIALPSKSTDLLKPSTPLISGKHSFNLFSCCITSEPIKSGWNFYFDQQTRTCPTDRRHRNPPRPQVRVYSLHRFLPLLI